jgi:chemotaxis signal transduction protein
MPFMGSDPREREMQKESLEKKEERQILVFSVASEELGSDISCVREVIKTARDLSTSQDPALH